MCCLTLQARFLWASSLLNIQVLQIRKNVSFTTSRRRWSLCANRLAVNLRNLLAVAVRYVNVYSMVFKVYFFHVRSVKKKKMKTCLWVKWRVKSDLDGGEKNLRDINVVYVGDFMIFSDLNDSSFKLINHSNCLISSCFFATLFIESIDLRGNSLLLDSSALSLQTFLNPTQRKTTGNDSSRISSSCIIHDLILEDSRRSSS